MGRNSASPDHDSSGDDDTFPASAGGGKGGGLGLRSIRDRIRFKRNPNPSTTTSSNRAKTASSADRQWRAGHGRSHHHGRSAARRFLLFPFRGSSLFYFCLLFAVFAFALASMVLQSSIASVFRTGTERGRSVREGLKFGSSLKFVPWRVRRGLGLDRLRSELRIGVRPPRIALILGNMKKDPASLMLSTVTKKLHELGYVLKIYAVEDGKARSMWEEIGGQISILSPDRYGHIDWSIFEGIIVNSLEAKDAISSLMQEPFCSVPLIWIIQEDTLANRLPVYEDMGWEHLISHWKKVFSRADVIVFPDFSLPMLYSVLDMGNFFVIPGSPIDVWAAESYSKTHSKIQLRMDNGFSKDDMLVLVVGSSFFYNELSWDYAVAMHDIGPLLIKYASEKDSIGAFKFLFLCGNSTDGYSDALQEMSSGTGSLGSTSGTPMEEDDHAPLWCYVTKLEKLGGGGNTRFKCNYCQQEYRGSYFRVKAHLLKLSGNGIRVCPKVTPEHLAEMQRKIEEAEKRLKMAMPKKVPLPPSTQSTSTGSGALDIGGFKMEGYEPRKRKATGTSALEKAFNPVIREQLHSEIARMFYSAGLPFHLSRNPYYVSAFQFAANNPIPGYVPPGYNLLRTTLLQKERANVERLLEPTRASWKEKGLSIVSDGWTDSQRRPLINFMGASEAGAVFLKAVNCEGEHKDKFFISNLISQAIEEVGHQNVIQVITNNAPVCSAAGLLIESKYPNIFWTPCVVHTLNLAVKNICAPKETGGTAFAYDECHWITLCVDDVMFIKNFIMNHSMRLAIFNEFVPLKLLAVADTRFASAIIMLKRFKLIKRGLQSMVISDQWVSYKEDDVGKAASVKEKLLNDVWWDKIDYILSFTLPIYEMLRFCDTDKPCLHLVYEMWDTMIEKVKATIFRHEGKLDHEESIFYSVVHNILVERWSKSNTPLHCLAHSLNPRYYSSTWLDENPNRVPPHRDEEISSMRNKCFKKYFPNLEERRVVNVEYAKFSGGLDMFGDFDSKIDRGVLDPLIWWFTHGSPAPMLQSLALKLLGQPCSSSCCERNWSTYSFIHSMKRNKMTPKRAEDLVFVHNNLRLLSRRSRQYIEGESKLWDVGGDAFDSLEGAGLLEIASLSLDEPDMEAVIFTEDEGEQVEPIDVEDS